MPESEKPDDYEKGWAEGFARGRKQTYEAFKWWYEKNVSANRNMIGQDIRESIVDQIYYSSFSVEEAIFEYLRREMGIFPTQISAMESREITEIASSQEDSLHQQIEKGVAAAQALYGDDIIPQAPELDDLIEDYSRATRKKTS
ncbi:hypothetical protein HYW46_07290 [Candidatus Daviesbacteria bacterium]|nr:hypothetical protein [Candidatus Daviesbacteria bacterium]